MTETKQGNLLTSFEAQLRSIGVARSLGGKDSFSVQGEDRIWITLCGAVDLFLPNSDLPAGIDRGRRRFVTRIDALTLFQGSETDSISLLAVPTNGSEILETTFDKLISLAKKDTRWGTQVAALIDGWITALGPVLTRQHPAPRGSHLMKSGKYDVEAGDIYQANKVLWLVEAPENSEIQGMPCENISETNPILICPAGWLRCMAEGTIGLADTASFLTSGSALKTALLVFQNAVHTSAVDYWAEIQKTETGRVKERATKRRQIMEASTRQMIGLASGSKATFQIDTSKPLVSALSLVSDALGIDAVFDGSIKGDKRDPLSAIIRHAGLYHRTISLEPGWWDSDCGPILAFQGQWDRPCALLPQVSGGYVLVNTRDGSHRKVSETVARELNGRAFVLYRPFPNKKLSFKDVLKTGFPSPKKDIITLLSMAVSFGMLSLLTPIFASEITETVIPEARIDQLVLLIVALAVAAVASGGFSMIQSIAVLRLEGRADSILQAAIWDRLMRAPVSFFRRFTIGDLTQRALSFEAIRGAVSAQIVVSLLATFSGLFSLALMFYYDARLSIVVMIVISIWILLNIWLSSRLAKITTERLRLERLQLAKAFQFINGIVKLRASGSEQFAFGIWSRLFSGTAKISAEQFRVQRHMSVMSALLAMLSTGIVVAVLAIQGDQLFSYFHVSFTWAEIQKESLTSVMSTADFIGFNVALGQVMFAAQSLSNAWSTLVTLKPYYNQVKPILEIEPEQSEGVEDPGDLTGDIEISGVSFRYGSNDPLILEKLSIDIKAGQHVAIVGPSGSGKSTLVRLLLGFEEPEQGSIYLDGRDMRRMDKQAVRRSFGVVLQDGRLMTGSIYENIVAGANLSEEDAWKAARAAGLAEDIERMPMGMHTVLTDGASTISGGQRQRLMIARAIVHKPRILIFDEATSALDNRTQAIVTNSLNSMQCTRISIAHRLSTIQQADRIFMIDKGCIVDQGSFEELIESGGPFAELAQRQMAES